MMPMTRRRTNQNKNNSIVFFVYPFVLSTPTKMSDNFILDEKEFEDRVIEIAKGRSDEVRLFVHYYRPHNHEGFLKRCIEEFKTIEPVVVFVKASETNRNGVRAEINPDTIHTRDHEFYKEIPFFATFRTNDHENKRGIIFAEASFYFGKLNWDFVFSKPHAEIYFVHPNWQNLEIN